MVNLLVPRNIEGRKEKLKQMNIRMLSQEVINGDLNLDESFMGIDAKFVKIKKVHGNVRLSGGEWIEIPEWLKDVEISGGFYCSYNKLTTLKNCPQNIGRYFDCEFNKLTSLEGCPKHIKGPFNCIHNQLTSLEGCPENIGRGFYCSNNLLTSLENCPENIGRDFYCCKNEVELKLPDYVKLKGKFYNK